MLQLFVSDVFGFIIIVFDVRVFNACAKSNNKSGFEIFYFYNVVNIS